jgi:N-acetylmuramoyl-L-alanine amidase
MHTVEQGEYLASIAKDYGFADWRTIYDHPNNAELKKTRPNPNILLPGDEIFIPDKELKKESCATERHWRFQVKVPKAWLRLVVKDSEGKVFENEPYTLVVAAETFQGNTDGAGSLKHKIPIGIEYGQLSLDKLGLIWPLKIGHLDPINDGDDEAAIISGVQARLNNLGFHCGEVDGELDGDTTAAVMEFQRTVLNRDEPTGELDSETLDKLRAEHGC